MQKTGQKSFSYKTISICLLVFPYESIIQPEPIPTHLGKSISSFLITSFSLALPTSTGVVAELEKAKFRINSFAICLMYSEESKCSFIEVWFFKYQLTLPFTLLSESLKHELKSKLILIPLYLLDAYHSSIKEISCLVYFDEFLFISNKNGKSDKV